MSIKVKIIVYISLLFIIAIGNGLFTKTLENNSEIKLQWVNHTHYVIHTTDLLLSSLQDAETGQRGYLLTSKSEYLEPYYIGIKKTNDLISELKDLVSDNKSQLVLIDKLERNIQLKLAELNETIDKADKGEIDEALKIVNANIGKEYMDEIRRTISEFINVEKILLEQRKTEYEIYKTKISTIILVEIILFIFLAILTISFLNRTLFEPLKLLLKSTQEMENGEKVKVRDIVSKDEMGFLLSSFYEMNHKITSQVKILDHKAHHDDLTGLLNRTSLKSSISNSILTSKFKTAIIFIDLNDFKLLNDTLGHDVGDEVLKITATRLEDSIRLSDNVFRLGGDEFVILLKDIPDLVSVKSIISGMISKFDQQVSIKGHKIEITLSIGVSVAPDYGINPSELLKFADIAMYESKKIGKNEYTIYDYDKIYETD